VPDAPCPRQPLSTGVGKGLLGNRTRRSQLCHDSSPIRHLNNLTITGFADVLAELTLEFPNSNLFHGLIVVSCRPLSTRTAVVSPGAEARSPPIDVESKRKLGGHGQSGEHFRLSSTNTVSWAVGLPNWSLLCEGAFQAEPTEDDYE